MKTEGWTETIRAQCALCGEKMQLVEGDVIFGEKWYHQNCAKQVKLDNAAQSRYSV